jgi:hypothetical protein
MRRCKVLRFGVARPARVGGFVVEDRVRLGALEASVLRAIAAFSGRSAALRQ